MIAHTTWYVHSRTYASALQIECEEDGDANDSGSDSSTSDDWQLEYNQQEEKQVDTDLSSESDDSDLERPDDSDPESEPDPAVVNSFNLLMFCREMLELVSNAGVSQVAMERILKITRVRLGPMMPELSQLDFPTTYYMLKKRAGSVKVRHTKPTVCDAKDCNAVVSAGDESKHCHDCGNELRDERGMPRLRMLEFDLLGIIRDLWASPVIAKAFHQLGARRSGQSLTPSTTDTKFTTIGRETCTHCRHAHIATTGISRSTVCRVYRHMVVITALICVQAMAMRGMVNSYAGCPPHTELIPCACPCVRMVRS